MILLFIQGLLMGCLAAIYFCKGELVFGITYSTMSILCIGFGIFFIKKGR